MKELLDQFLKSKDSTGCDIGAASTKFIALSKERDGLSLKALGIIEANLLTENSVSVQRVKTYFKEHGISGCKANLNIEDQTLKIRRMDLP